MSMRTNTFLAWFAVVLLACAQEQDAAPGGTDRGASRAAPEKRIGAGMSDLPTVVCDGKGGYRPDLRKGKLFPCLIPKCFTVHEMVHVADWKKHCPKGCKDKKDGADAPRDGKTCPKWKEESDYNAFLADSECRAYKEDIKCLKDLLALVERSGPKAAHCVDWVKAELRRSGKQKKRHCPEESGVPLGFGADESAPAEFDTDWGEDAYEEEEGEDEEPNCAVPYEGSREPPDEPKQGDPPPPAPDPAPEPERACLDAAAYR